MHGMLSYVCIINQYLQIDSHMHFIKDWDKISISMLKGENSKFIKRSVLSYLPYPVTSTKNEKEEVVSQSPTTTQPLPQICNGYFSNGPFDSQIIRLNTTSVVKKSAESTSESLETRKNPFVVAGNLMTTAGALCMHSRHSDDLLQ